MVTPLAMDLWDRAMARLDAGETLSRGDTRRCGFERGEVVATAARDGQCRPGKIAGHVPRKIAGNHAIWLRARMGKAAFTFRGLVVEPAERGLRVDKRTVWAFAHAEGLSIKKSALASEQDRPDVAHKRRRWKAR